MFFLFYPYFFLQFILCCIHENCTFSYLRFANINYYLFLWTARFYSLSAYNRSYLPSAKYLHKHINTLDKQCPAKKGCLGVNLLSPKNSSGSQPVGPTLFCREMKKREKYKTQVWENRNTSHSIKNKYIDKNTWNKVFFFRWETHGTVFKEAEI